MFNVLGNIESKHVKSYVTHDNAVRAVREAVEARPSLVTDERIFNVLMVNNSKGRFVPILCNINPDHFHVVLHLGFMVVN